MRTRVLIFGLSGLLAFGLGCASEVPPAPAPAPVPEGCNPVGASVDCLLPFPSDVFLEGEGADARLRIPEGVLPTAEVDDVEVPIDFLRDHPAAGFSPAPVLLARFADPIDDASLVFHTDADLDRALTAESPTVVLDAETGAPVPHFAELDPLPEEGEERLLVIHPLVRLEGEHRYVVGIHGLSTPDGAPVQAPASFAELRDGAAPPEDDALLERYDREVFPVLEAHGVARDALQLAWDFTVRPDADAVHDMQRAREIALDAFAAEPPPVSLVEATTPGGDLGDAQVLEIAMTVPQILTDDDEALLRDADGEVVANGTREIRVTVVVPASVLTAPAGAELARPLILGHGFFGSREEALSSFAAPFAERFRFVIFAVTWIGLARDDVGRVPSDILADPSGGLRFTDRLHQAMVNQLALARAIQTTLPELAALQRADEAPLYDPTALAYYGNSMGHILGGTFMALTPDVDRAIFGVGGGGFSLMLFRALPFAAFRVLLKSMDVDAIELQKFAALSQTTFDRIDPVVYAPAVRDPGFGGLFEGGPTERHVLMQLGIGDPAVPNLCGHLHARALGLPLLTPAARPVYGLEPSEPETTSALVEMDFALPDPLPGTYADLAWGDNEVHEAVRRNDPGQRQADAFLHPTGTVLPMCEGPCDPD